MALPQHPNLNFLGGIGNNKTIGDSLARQRWVGSAGGGLEWAGSSHRRKAPRGPSPLHTFHPCLLPISIGQNALARTTVANEALGTAARGQILVAAHPINPARHHCQLLESQFADTQASKASKPTHVCAGGARGHCAGAGQPARRLRSVRQHGPPFRSRCRPCPRPTPRRRPPYRTPPPARRCRRRRRHALRARSHRPPPGGSLHQRADWCAAGPKGAGEPRATKEKRVPPHHPTRMRPQPLPRTHFGSVVAPEGRPQRRPHPAQRARHRDTAAQHRACKALRHVLGASLAAHGNGARERGHRG